jgi:hypothetical protein
MREMYKVINLEQTIKEFNIQEVEIDNIMDVYYCFEREESDLATNFLKEGYYYAKIDENYYTMCQFLSGELYIHDFNNLLDGVKWLVDDVSYDESSIISNS